MQKPYQDLLSKCQSRDIILSQNIPVKFGIYTPRRLETIWMRLFAWSPKAAGEDPDSTSVTDPLSRLLFENVLSETKATT